MLGETPTNGACREMKQIVARFLIVVMTLASCSCSYLGHRTQPLAVKSNPDGAMVFINGNLAGTTPYETRINRGRTVTIVLRKEGYYPATVTTSGDLSTLGVIDTIGGMILLLPFIGLFSSGAYRQQPDVWSVTLVETSRRIED